MADSFIQLPVDGVGKLLNTSQKIVGLNTVQSERHVITDNVNNNYANVSAAGGLQVDGSAVVQPVSGTITTTPPANASTNITQVGGSALTEGQKVMASSVPVVIASDQSAVPVSGTVSVSNFPATQPVSGSVSVSNFPATQAVSAASLPLPTGASTAAKQPALGTAGTPSADIITVQGVTSMTPIKTDGSAVVQPVSGTVTANAGTGNFTVVQATGTNLHAVLDTGSTTAVTQATAANLNATVVGTVAATQSGTWTVQPGNTPNTTAWVVTSNKSNNSAAPGTTNLGTLPAVANAAPPAFTEANQAAISIDLAGNLRVYGHPPNVLGAYMINGRTTTYAGLPAAAPLFSFRWGSSTALAVIQRVRVNVATTIAATTAGQAERELIVARGFTASDTGGTAVTLTGNNQKMRTSQGTSLVTDMRFGITITPGTRTLDANPISSVVSWLGLNFIGVDIGGGGAGTSTATSLAASTWVGIGGTGMVPLLDAITGQDYPLVLAQNEGFIIRIGKDPQPAGATQQTYVNISWCEVSAY